MKYPIAERAHSINGVPGRMSAIQAPERVRDRKVVHLAQKWVSEKRSIQGYGAGADIQVSVRFDDCCKNGHQSFAITADVTTPTSRRRNDSEACGCLHEDIAEVFPELVPLIKWHLMDTDGPMHYVANTVYHASNRADQRYEPGQPCAWENFMLFGNSPWPVKVKDSLWRFAVEALKHNDSVPVTSNNFVHFKVIEVPHVSKPGETYEYRPQYTFEGLECKWAFAPFDDRYTAEAFAEAMLRNKREPGFVKMRQRPTDWAKEKPRNLAYARSSACWPEATDEQLCLPGAELAKLLEDRLPGLMAEFRADMDRCGFLWDQEVVAA